MRGGGHRAICVLFHRAGAICIAQLAICIAQLMEGKVTNAGLIGIALAHGCVLAVMVSAMGHISGAHFNPAVTVGALVGEKISGPMAGAYIVSQFLSRDGRLWYCD